MAKSKLKAETKDDDILIWNGDQCLLHLQRVDENRIDIDVYLQPHSHIRLESEAPIVSTKDPKKALRKTERHANIESGKSDSQEQHDAAITES